MTIKLNYICIGNRASPKKVEHWHGAKGSIVLVKGNRAIVSLKEEKWRFSVAKRSDADLLMKKISTSLLSLLEFLSCLRTSSLTLWTVTLVLLVETFWFDLKIVKAYFWRQFIQKHWLYSPYTYPYIQIHFWTRNMNVVYWKNSILYFKVL